MPTKAWYLRFEDRPDLEFDFFLAAKLGMSVAQMRETVAGDEWVGWAMFYGRKGQRDELAAKAR